MNMRVPDEILKSVVFIGARKKDGEPVYRGTGFLVSVAGAHGDPSWIFLVTARHIAEKLEGSDFVVRVNRKEEDPVVMEGKGSKWWYHPTDRDGVDAAVTTFGPPTEVGASLDIGFLPLAMFVEDSTLKMKNIGIGDQVFITGLFTQLQRTSRNMPILRTGTVAMMPEEKIQFGDRLIEAYLVESRSIGGLSGSPVFVRSTVPLGGFMDSEHKPSTPYATSGTFYLLGSMIGHWDAPPDGLIIQEEKVNMGISPMVPAKKIAEIINHPELVEMRKKWDEDVVRKRDETPRPVLVEEAESQDG